MYPLNMTQVIYLSCVFRDNISQFPSPKQYNTQSNQIVTYGSMMTELSSSRILILLKTNPLNRALYFFLFNNFTGYAISKRKIVGTLHLALVSKHHSVSYILVFFCSILILTGYGID